MQAMTNIQTLNGYNVKKIVTACPHCFNTLKNEYPELGGNYDVIHHSTFLQQLIDDSRIKISDNEVVKGKKHYFSRFLLPRPFEWHLYGTQKGHRITSHRDQRNENAAIHVGLCCGAGGAQMFKDAEPGDREINIERTEEALGTGANIIATGCPILSDHDA